MKQIALLLSLLVVALYVGCGEENPSLKPASTMPALQPDTMPCTTAPASVAVPSPLSLLLPKTVRLDPFTGARIQNEEGRIAGLEVRVEALDHFNDAAKAFGNFRFELYRFDPTKPDSRGDRLAVWNVDLQDPDQNKKHWNGITRRYQFRLAWNEGIPVGRKFIVGLTYNSPFSPRLFDQRTFVAGQ